MNCARLIYCGSSREFIDALCVEARSHKALNHPYFDLFNCLSEIEADEALRDFVYQYSFYSRHFDAYNDAVLSTLDIAAYRAVLEENIADEQGTAKPGFEGLPHREMFAQFAERIGINDRYRSLHDPTITAMVWSDLFLQKCSSRIPGVALAAISIGTEFIVPDVYKHILELINRSSFFNIEEKYFFTLHSECDVEHSQQLIELLYDFCGAAEHREAVRFGAMSALNLRAAFFDVMAARLEEILCRGNSTIRRRCTIAPQQRGVEVDHAAYLT